VPQFSSRAAIIVEQPDWYGKGVVSGSHDVTVPKLVSGGCVVEVDIQETVINSLPETLRKKRWKRKLDWKLGKPMNRIAKTSTIEGRDGK